MPANLFIKMDVTLGNSFSRLSTIGFHYHLSIRQPWLKSFCYLIDDDAAKCSDPIEFKIRIAVRSYLPYHSDISE